MITTLRIGNGYVSPNRKEYLIDNESDVANLPTNLQDGTGTVGRCDPGSLAYTADMSKVYMLGNDGQWYDCTEA